VKVGPNIIREEFIGLHAKVVKSRHPGYVGIEGPVVDETHNMFIIGHEGRRKMVPKAACTFHFTFPDGTVVEIEGHLLVGRPEDRLKKRLTKLW